MILLPLQSVDITYVYLISRIETNDMVKLLLMSPFISLTKISMIITGSTFSDHSIHSHL
jgi:hypothetical protein